MPCQALTNKFIFVSFPGVYLNHVFFLHGVEYLVATISWMVHEVFAWFYTRNLDLDNLHHISIVQQRTFKTFT